MGRRAQEHLLVVKDRCVGTEVEMVLCVAGVEAVFQCIEPWSSRGSKVDAEVHEVGVDRAMPDRYGEKGCLRISHVKLSALL